uniref:Protein kinase n=1 Tax=Pithovirus LCPAC302 TaxID=2506593 RepID=A0A481Z775_9VIRU|nr:MAG: protein kinase [Pithovirus LCPAC302]
MLRRREKIPLIRSCVADTNIVSPNCTDLFKRYKVIGEIAENVGTFGIIFEVYNTERKEKSILKVLKSFGEITNNEIYIGCVLTYNKLPGFVKYKDYFICDQTPDDFLVSLERSYSPEDMFVYIEMEKGDGSLYNLLYEIKAKLTPEDIKSVLFEMLYSIHLARYKLGFVHNDIKEDNILYKAEPNPRVYELENGQKVKAASIYRPLFIDFGRSSVIDHESSAGRDERLDQEAMITVIKRIDPENLVISMMKTDMNLSITLNSDYFKELYI